jgi:hypothetical protein
VRAALQVPGGEPRRRTGTVLALREDAARARLWEQDVETVAMTPTGSPSAEAARRLEVLLDLLGCLSTPPTGYLLDPAYRGLLDDDERRLAEALTRMADELPEPGEGTSAATEVADLLRRLGAGSSVEDRETAPPDERTDLRDDRRQEQRPG